MYQTVEGVDLMAHVITVSVIDYITARKEFNKLRIKRKNEVISQRYQYACSYT